MLKASDITQAGSYWYRPFPETSWTVVEIGPEGGSRTTLEVRFGGRDDWDMLDDMSGEFMGPIQPPPG